MTNPDFPFLYTYSRYPITLVEGEGHRVRDEDGRWYLDAICGIAVMALGHRHPRVLEAVHAQVDALMHTSNLYRVPVQTALAQRLVDVYGGVGVFLCNSGGEANEAAHKLVRKHHWRQAGAHGDDSPRVEIIVAAQAFHGRTLMTLGMTPRAKYQRGFGPFPGAVRVLPADEIAGAISARTAAVWVEPVQGEGGCRPIQTLPAIRAACDAHGALLVYDEIQCGLGRTGELCHDPAPDIITLAKALGGGLPLGACVALSPALADTFQPGDHGSTFGGNPVACAAGLATLDVILEQDLPARCRQMGARLRAGLEATGCEVTGRGLILAAHLGRPSGEVVDAMRARGVLVCSAGATAVRFLPPFTVGPEAIDELVSVFADSLTA